MRVHGTQSRGPCLGLPGIAGTVGEDRQPSQRFLVVRIGVKQPLPVFHGQRRAIALLPEPGLFGEAVDRGGVRPGRRAAGQ